MNNRASERWILDLNKEWRFSLGDIKGARAADFDDSNWQSVALPHSFSLPYDIHGDAFYIGAGWYRRRVFAPAELNDAFIRLDFGGAFQTLDLYINGERVPASRVYGHERDDSEAPTHEGGYAGFSVDITGFMRAGADNFIAARVDNTWKNTLAPRGGDYQFTGGLYRGVTMIAQSRAHIDWHGVFVWAPMLTNPAFQASENRPDSLYESDFERFGTGVTNTLDDPSVDGEYVTESELLENIALRRSNVEIRTEITNSDASSRVVRARHTLFAMSGDKVAEFESPETALLPGARATLTARSRPIENVALWSFDAPNLYVARTELIDARGNTLDCEHTRFGFRSVQFKLDGFYLNGKKTLLDGANVHQDHGGWTDAVSDRGFFRDVQYVKDTGFNFIRGSHYPHAEAFSDACDILGVGLWSEGGLWGVGGFTEGSHAECSSRDWLRGAYPPDESARAGFEKSCFDVIRSMIRVHRNHPSVLIWSTGNEAFFCDERVDEYVKRLAGRLRDYAHSLDFTRKTALGGTQRKNLNVLAVCDLAGGNGDGGRAERTNFYLPHIVSEYGSKTGERPGDGALFYDEIARGKSYVLPEKVITLADGSTALSQSAGLAIWCMYHHGSVCGHKFAAMGIMDYYRLPLERRWAYRADRRALPAPEAPSGGEPAFVRLEAFPDGFEHPSARAQMSADGRNDVQIVATLLDKDYRPTRAERELLLRVEYGPGVFPTGKEYAFKPGRDMFSGRASIEFRAWHPGKTRIIAYVNDPNIQPGAVEIETTGEGGQEPSDFFVKKETRA